MGLAETNRCMIQLVKYMDTDYYRQQQLASGVCRVSVELVGTF